jgi:hypothetical protein
MSIFSRRSLPAIAAGSVIIGSLALAAAPALAAGSGAMRPAIAGKVTAVSGDTLTVTSAYRQRGNTSSSPTSAVYTVDASHATVLKGGQSSSVSAIAAGDAVMVQGTVSGTNVAATVIRDNIPGSVRGSKAGWAEHASSTLPAALEGNGEPVVGGTVSTVNGSSFTVATKAGQTYAIDATNATITKPGTASSTIANVAVGDSVIVQGAINGTSVVASSIHDQSANGATSGAPAPAHKSLFGTIDGFFSHLFGFF